MDVRICFFLFRGIFRVYYVEENFIELYIEFLSLVQLVKEIGSEFFMCFMDLRNKISFVLFENSDELKYSLDLLYKLFVRIV